MIAAFDEIAPDALTLRKDAVETAKANLGLMKMMSSNLKMSTQRNKRK